jgi:polysaccharide biosynthesis/export protein
VAKTLACVTAIWALLTAQTIAGIAQQAGSQATDQAADQAPPLRIGSGDLVEITMYENPDLSGRFRVDERGDISVPLIGTVHVEGATAGELAAIIEKRFIDAQILQPEEAHATVFIAEYANQGITLTGEVRSPGVYPALGVRMLNDVITGAGGVTQFASTKLLITHQRDPDHRITVEYNPEALKPVIPNVQIFPGDTVMIPRAGIIYIVGNVSKPGLYILEGRDELTVEEAMALAGGGGKAAAIKRTQLVRKLEDGRKEAITIPVNLIYKGKAPDVALKDGDILYVPTSGVKLAAEQIGQAALGIGTSIAIYRTNQ